MWSIQPWPSLCQRQSDHHRRSRGAKFKGRQLFDWWTMTAVLTVGQMDQVSIDNSIRRGIRDSLLLRHLTVDGYTTPFCHSRSLHNPSLTHFTPPRSSYPAFTEAADSTPPSDLILMDQADLTALVELGQHMCVLLLFLREGPSVLSLFID